MYILNAEWSSVGRVVTGMFLLGIWLYGCTIKAMHAIGGGFTKNVESVNKMFLEYTSALHKCIPDNCMVN